MKKLNELMDSDSDIVIENLMQDSRKPCINGLFFAIKGASVDGHDYISMAINNGAIAIVHSDNIDKVPGIYYYQCNDVLATLNEAAKRFYNNPSQHLSLVGITGTNGKSSIAFICNELLKRLKHKSGYIGTICIEYNDKRITSSLTTPEIVPLQAILADMVNDGIDSVCMEVSSQGLALKRCDSLTYDAVIFSNLTHDHLDFHKTIENYLEAKLTLFKKIKLDGMGVVNLDDAYCKAFIDATQNPIITYSIINPRADLYANNIKMDFNLTTFDLHYQNRIYSIKTNLLANFNIANLLAAIGGVLALKHDIAEIVNCLDDFRPINGRLQVFKAGQPYNVVVDYAHTPDAMEKILSFMKSITPINNQLIVCFGSAGGRDAMKRPDMGAIADKYADVIILCEDDNRDETPLKIAQEIALGITKHTYEFIENRQLAIKRALLLARSLDTICILGKGNDAYMARSNGKEFYLGDDNIVDAYLKDWQNLK